MRTLLLALPLLALPLIALPLAAQLGSLESQPPKARQYVVYVAEQQTITAGRRAVLELRFHVVDGYHVNSHKPASDLLIPTVVDLQTEPGIKAGAVDYPAGHEYTLPSDPPDKLDVYSGDFIVKVPVTAAAGQHDLHGMLKYQACNNAACYPPRSLTITVPINAK